MIIHFPFSFNMNHNNNIELGGFSSKSYEWSSSNIFTLKSKEAVFLASSKFLIPMSMSLRVLLFTKSLSRNSTIYIIGNENERKSYTEEQKSKIIFSNQLIAIQNLSFNDKLYMIGVPDYNSKIIDRKGPFTHCYYPNSIPYNDKLNIIAVSDHCNQIVTIMAHPSLSLLADDDLCNYRLKIMDKKGALIRCFPFQTPRGIAIIPSLSLLAVSYYSKHVIEIFDISSLLPNNNNTSYNKKGNIYKNNLHRELNAFSNLFTRCVLESLQNDKIKFGQLWNSTYPRILPSSNSDTAKVCGSFLTPSTNYQTVTVNNYKYQEDEEEKRKELQIFIKMLNGRTTTMNVNRKETILSLKHKIEDKEGIPINQQRLIFRGKRLDDRLLIEDYPIEYESFIHLSLHLKGGSPNHFNSLQQVETILFQSVIPNLKENSSIFTDFLEKKLFMDALDDTKEDGEVGDAVNALNAKFFTEYFTAAAISICNVVKCMISLRDSYHSRKEIIIIERNFITKIDLLICNYNELIDTTNQYKNGTITLEVFMTNLLALSEESLSVINQILNITIPYIQMQLSELARQNDQIITILIYFSINQIISGLFILNIAIASIAAGISIMCTFAILQNHAVVFKSNAPSFQQNITERKYLKTQIKTGVSRVKQKNEPLLLLIEARYQEFRKKKDTHVFGSVF